MSDPTSDNRDQISSEAQPKTSQSLNPSSIYPTPQSDNRVDSAIPPPNLPQPSLLSKLIPYLIVIILITGVTYLTFYLITKKKNNTKATNTTNSSNSSGYLHNLAVSERKAKDLQAKSNLRSVATYLEYYYDKNNNYPKTNSYQLMIEQLITSQVVSSSPTAIHPGYIYKYCSSAGARWNLEVNLLDGNELYKTSSNDGKDSCSPGV